MSKSVRFFCSFAMLFASSVILALAATFSIDSFSARSDGKNITIEFRTGKEADIAKFEIERSISTLSPDYKSISTLEARNMPNVYKFVDENAYMRSGSTSTAGNIYLYRIKITGNDGSIQYSAPVSVTHNVSSVRRTWGMIKDMFR